MATTLDTPRIAQALKAAGFDDDQSEAIVVAIQTSLGENVATKSDLDTGLSKLRADMYRALWIQGAGLVMVITAMTVIAIAFS